MNFFKLFTIVAIVSLAACASNTSSSQVANSDENFQTETSSSSASYGIVPIDTTIQDYVDPIEGTISSASKTEYRFSTERTILYDSLDVFVVAYYQEKSVQGSHSLEGGSAVFTYRLLNSPTDPSKIFVGWLLSGGYWSDHCLSDSSYFVNRCKALVGELVDYNNGCSVNNLQLSCVYPYESGEATDSVETLNAIGKEFLEFSLGN